MCVMDTHTYMYINMCVNMHIYVYKYIQCMYIMSGSDSIYVCDIYIYMRLFLNLCVHLYVCVCVHMCSAANEKRMLESLKLEVQVVVGHPT